MLHFRSFRTRLIVFFVGLLILVQATAFLLVNSANIDNARAQINEDLISSAGIFNSLIEERTFGLLVNARLLSGDYAFKEAYSTKDHGTVLSAMENHLDRIGADSMVLVSLDGKIIADTMRPEVRDVPNSWPALVNKAEGDEYGEAASILDMNGLPYQTVVVPLLIPDVDAWILIGFLINEDFAREVGKLSEVSVLQGRPGGQLHNVASTLSPELAAQLPATLAAMDWAADQSITLDMKGSDYVSLVTPLVQNDDLNVFAVLQRSLADELRPYLRLRTYLILLFSVGFVLSAAMAIFMARSVTRPVLELATAARRIAGGDYGQRVQTRQRDEIGVLAHSFNDMAKGLAEKERVRNLLGKVVSPQIAEELLSKEIELGGEERVVTILFSDVRNFTSLCENRSPQEILSLLNVYLTRVSAVVEGHGGVVDKYIGDAVMALFGAPLQHADDAARAVHTGMGMVSALETLNAEFRERGMPPLGMGIGINTATVVAGNMGSESRLNYTVIGDGVNLASRLESLTKRYEVPIIVNQSTRDAAPDFVYRELDRVRVKGKQEPVSIFAPLGEKSAFGAQDLEQLARYHDALALFRERRWNEANAAFADYEAGIGGGTGCVLSAMYRERIERYREQPPDKDWDGSWTYTEK